MKKVWLALTAVAAFTLTGCDKLVEVDATKANLEKSGYTVEMLDEAGAKEKIKTLNFNVKVSSILYASKEGQVFMAFYCQNLDFAGNFAEANSTALLNYAKKFVAKPIAGKYRNAAYVGSETSAKDSGFPVTYSSTDEYWRS